jgi:hypothetical protein
MAQELSTYQSELLHQNAARQPDLSVAERADGPRFLGEGTRRIGGRDCS